MNHYELAKLCQDSYKYATFSVSDCEVLLRYDGDACHVVCRGTEIPQLFPDGHVWGNLKNALDVIRDIRIIPWYDKDLGWCHAGFLKGGIGLAEFIEKNMKKETPLHFTGHSLGGALALACAAKLQAKGYNVVTWVGFGSPKLQYSKKLYRFQQVAYRYKNDVVTLMPRIWGYRHNCPVIRLLSDKINKGKASWDDHGISLYVMALRKTLAGDDYFSL